MLFSYCFVLTIYQGTTADTLISKKSIPLPAAGKFYRIVDDFVNQVP